MDEQRWRDAHLSLVAARGAARTSALLDAGLDRAAIETLVHTGAIVRVRTGWFALPATDRRILDCVARGGAAACATSLAIHGVWIADSSPTHLLLPCGSRGETGVVAHRAARGTPVTFCLEPLRDAIARAIRCLPFDEAVAAVDSALHLSGTLGWRFDRADLVDVIAMLPRRYRRLLDWVDPLADSGLESLVRVRLRSIGIEARPQVAIDGVGRVDLLVGDRLVIETDGKAYHLGAQFERDRHRDAELLRRGYRRLRLTWSDVMHDWPATERLIVELVRLGEHRGRTR